MPQVTKRGPIIENQLPSFLSGEEHDG